MGLLDTRWGDPNARCRYINDFLESSLVVAGATTPWNVTATGAGAYANIDPTLRNGILRLTGGSSGGTRTGGAWWTGNQLSPALTRYMKFRAKTLETANEQIIQFGMGDYVAPATVTNGIYFERVTGSVWRGVCESGGVPTTAPMTTVADTSWHDFEIYINDPDVKSQYTSNNSSVVFRIDYSDVAVVVSNIPTANLNLYMFAQALLAGLVNSNLYIDYVDLYMDRETP